MGGDYGAGQLMQLGLASSKPGVQEHRLCQDRERDLGCIPGSDMAHRDAAGVNGSSRISLMALRISG